MQAAVGEQRRPSVGITPDDEVLSEQLYGLGVSARNQRLRQEERQPVAPQELAHGLFTPDAADSFVVLMVQHGSVLME